jgi:hypothetical protein
MKINAQQSIQSENKQGDLSSFINSGNISDINKI